jgi:hypothetical protein
LEQPTQTLQGIFWKGRYYPALLGPNRLVNTEFAEIVDMYILDSKEG